MIDKVNHVISDHIGKYFKLTDLRLINSFQGNMGACKDFEIQNLIIRVVNDRGILDLEVGSKYNKEKLRGISFFKDHLSPPKNGRHNLSIKEQVEFLSESFAILNTMMRRFSYKSIIKTIDDEQREILENGRLLKK